MQNCRREGSIIDDKGGKGERIHWILQSWSYHLKINFFKDINVTPERGCSRRQLVRHYYASSARRNNRVDPLKRIPAQSIKSHKIVASAMSPCHSFNLSFFVLFIAISFVLCRPSGLSEFYLDGQDCRKWVQSAAIYTPCCIFGFIFVQLGLIGA